MRFYTYLDDSMESAPSGAWCLECQLEIVPEHSRSETRDLLKMIRQRPLCYRYYRARIPYDIDTIVGARFKVYDLVSADNLCDLLLKKMRQPYRTESQAIALVEADVKHQYLSKPEVWHTDQIEIIQSWCFDSEFVSHLAEVWGDEVFHERWNVLLTVAIHVQNFSLYQELVAKHGEITPEIVPRCYYLLQDRISDFVKIAGPECRIDLLQKMDLQYPDVIEAVSGVDWDQMSQHQQNRIATRLIVCMSTAELRAVRQAGLTFDAGCVCCDFISLTRGNGVNPFEPRIPAMPFRHADYFRELGFPETCHQMCYVQAGLDGDLEAMKSLHPDMPAEIVISAFVAKIQDRSFRLHHNIWSQEPTTQTAASPAEVLAWLSQRLQLLDATVAAEKLCPIMLTNLRPEHIPIWQQLVTDAWPESAHATLQTYAERQQQLENLIGGDDAVNLDLLSAADVVDYLSKKSYHYTPNDFIRLTRRIMIPLDTPVTHTHARIFCEGETTWDLFLIFEAGCPVRQVLELAQDQNYQIALEPINQMLMPGGASDSICNIHAECYYSTILTPDMAIICQDLMRHNLLTSECQNMIQPWLHAEYNQCLPLMDNIDSMESDALC